MKADFDYNSVPYGFIHCFNEQCKQAADCLRRQVAFRIPPECSTITIINPSYTIPDGKDCPYFLADRLQPFALGISHLLDNVPHNDAVIIKQQMINYLKRSTYYRCWRRERLISPIEQEYIRKLFLNRGIKTSLAYDEYVEQYEW